jgi:PIN domain
MKTNYVLIDFESVQVKSLALLVSEHFRVRLFLGPNHTKVPSDLVLAMHDFGDRAKYVKLDAPGPNALDFHIAYYLGQLAAHDPTGFYHIISKDTGFDPLIAHLKTKKIFAARSASIEEMPCFLPAGAVGTMAPSLDPKPVTRSANGLDDLVKVALDDLIKRKAARPRKVSTLRSTVLARIGKDAESSLDAVIAALTRAGYVSAEGEKVTYHLPG